jgi:hypothetical protein
MTAQIPVIELNTLVKKFGEPASSFSFSICSVVDRSAGAKYVDSSITFSFFLPGQGFANIIKSHSFVLMKLLSSAGALTISFHRLKHIF